MRDHEVGPIALRDVEYLRPHFHTRRRYGEGPQLEPFLLLQVFDHRQRLLAGGIVIVDIGDFLALEAAAQFVFDELDGGSALREIARGDREQVGIFLAVRRCRDAETGRRRRDLVLFEPLVQRVGLRRAVHRHEHGTLLLLVLIGFDRRRHLVRGIDLGRLDRIAIKHMAGIDEVEIVVHRRAQHRPDDLCRAGAIALHADHDLFLLGRRRPGEAQRGRSAHDERQRRRRYASHHLRSSLC